jgi:hypothetical protein
VHVPPLQICPGAHTLPHDPQFKGSLSVAAQYVPQSANAVGSQVVPHVPPEHIVPGGQLLLHTPQLALSVSSFTHAPPQT